MLTGCAALEVLDIVALFVLKPVDVAPPSTMTDGDVWEPADCELLLVDTTVPFDGPVEMDVDVGADVGVDVDVDVKVFCPL